jgi:hypothetical protein
MSHERPVLRPSVYKTATRSGRDEGYEILFERINRYDERASAHVISELSLEDLTTLHAVLGFYLDTGCNPA